MAIDAWIWSSCLVFVHAKAALDCDDNHPLLPPNVTIDGSQALAI